MNKEFDKNQLFSLLSVICDQIAKGNYNQVKQLFSMTGKGEQNNVLEALAESFGMMLVKVEAREFQLEDTIQALKKSQASLEEAKAKLFHENSQLKANLQDLQTNNTPLHKLLGQSHSIQTLVKQIERISQVSAHVLILGETGSGKGVVANAIHDLSQRANKPFVSINCAAIPSSLLESELFGIEKGVASGVNARIGRFEQAHNGTLFLDEIGDLPLESQAKILHSLENASIERVGGRKAIPIDVRIIAATHRNLEAMCEEGSFRSDLYYRLNVLKLNIPSLRERKEDIPLLAKHFLSRCIQRNASFARIFSKEAITLLMNAPWPGNIRQLENEIERAAVLALGEEILPEDISFYQNTSSKQELEIPIIAETQKQETSSSILTKSIRETEKELVYRTLEETQGNKSEAARKLGITREGLRKKLKRLSQPE